MKYRAEIDGLRAVAVLPVILFHAGLGIFSGGYVGVDVFFVISGFLITRILIAELETGTFSLVGFYERRARRILPALFVVILACIPFAYMWMLPEQLEDFALSMIAVVFFSSNILFWLQSGYFAPDAELIPLLHTWSLAVEEQYYVLFPIILSLLWSAGRRTVLVTIVILAVASLVLAELSWPGAPDANFYLALTRAWELLAGSICAFLTSGKQQRNSETLSALGLAMIGYSILAFDASTPFPSFLTLMPVMGAALILVYGGKGTFVAALLSMRAIVGIGLISYSAYLIHQPLFAFARLRSILEPSQTTMISLALITLVLAWALWRFVEQPFRRREAPWLPTKRSLFGVSAGMGAVIVAFGATGYLGNGLNWRLNDKTLEVIARSKPVYFKCQDKRNCMIGDPDGTATGFALVGDSHMERYAYALHDVLKERQQSARLVASGWCAPLVHWSSSNAKRCGGASGARFSSTLSDVFADEDIHTVVIGARWSVYSGGGRPGRYSTVYDFTEDQHHNSSSDKNSAEFEAAFDQTIKEFAKAGKHIVVVGPVPEYSFNVPKIALRQSWLGDAERENFTTSRTDYETENRMALELFEAETEAFTFVDVWHLLCAKDICSPFSEDGFPLYNDDNHLVKLGMTDIVNEIVHEIDRSDVD